jgi:hypothetical protein
MIRPVFYILNNFYFKKLMSIFLAVQNKVHLKNQIFPSFFSQKLFLAKTTGRKEKKQITIAQGWMILSTFQLEGEEVTNFAFQKVKKAKKDKVNEIKKLKKIVICF